MAQKLDDNNGPNSGPNNGPNSGSTSYIQVYVDKDLKPCSGTCDSMPSNRQLVQIDAITELHTILIYKDDRKVPAWKAINTCVIKSFVEGVPVAIPCESDDVDIFVDMTLGHCIRQGVVQVSRNGATILSMCVVIPHGFRFPSGYDIIRYPSGALQMTSCAGRMTRGATATLIVWLGPAQALPVAGACNFTEYRFPVPISSVVMLAPIKVIDGGNRRNKYPTPINAYTKVVKAALESIKTGTPIYFKSIRADWEFIVDFSASQAAQTRTGFVHLSDIVHNITYEIRAQFPTNYVM